ncbi:MAG: TRAP transporter fused permease subunit [Methylobacteriaceae bacterium]|nr:TRAP transporter fused permease subunit [Methylobacteriaceae bacterium]
MSSTATTATDAPAAAVDPEHGLPSGFGGGATGRALFAVALAFATFQLAVSLYAVLPAQIVRAAHVGFLILLSAGLYAHLTARSAAARAFLWAVGLAGAAVAAYQWIDHDALLLRAGDLERRDVVMGVVALATIFIMVWRMMGPALPIIAGAFLAYALLGHLLPAPFNHRGYGLDQVIDQLAYGTEGIYGTPTGVSATYIFLFILFGAFLERAGMIELFTDIAMGLFGMARGGPAKVAVLSSALMGTISGSGVANVVATGQFTIPLMKRFGYAPSFAGGVEATASMGGQIMPPVMGAVAFIMAETLGIPYFEVVQAAIIPAILYFGAAFWSVHLEAGRKGLAGLPREELPNVRETLRKRWFLILPLAVLVYLLFAGFTPLYAGTIGLALTCVVILGGAIGLGLGAPALRVVFWIGLAIAASAALRFGVFALVGLIAALILATAAMRGGRATLALLRDSLADGARQALPVGLACALVGIVIGVMTLTGVATIVGNAVIGLGKDNLLLALILTMIFSLVLGMGIPTIPNYIITASLAAPILTNLGVPQIVAHMFVFYFGIMADLTPPVALAAFAAAPIPRASGLSSGLQAMRSAAAGFVVPYIAIYTPALMLHAGKGVDPWSAAFMLSVAYVAAKAALGIGLLGVASIGYLARPTPVWQRALALVASAMLIVAWPWTDEIGFALTALFLAAHFGLRRSAAAAA